MKRGILSAVGGGVIGFAVALLLFWAGPRIIEWIKGPPTLATDGWVFYVTTICGAGFGAVSGAIVGAASRGGSSS